jgi:hypothetical protein
MKSSVFAVLKMNQSPEVITALTLLELVGSVKVVISPHNKSLYRKLFNVLNRSSLGFQVEFTSPNIRTIMVVEEKENKECFVAVT